MRPRVFRWDKVPMTREEAQAFIALHKSGKPVRAIDLQEATRILARKRDRKLRLPQLSPAERQRVNGVLLYHLGLALGGSRRKAA